VSRASEEERAGRSGSGPAGGGDELPEEVVRGLLARWPVARLATLGPAGAQLLPVVFAQVGERLWSSVDGKPKRGGELARIRHVRSDPRVSLLLDEYTEEWNDLWWLRVSGRARAVEADPARDAEAAAAVAALVAKYPQYGEIPVLGDPPRLLCIEPLRLRSWCAGPQALARVRARLAEGR
jgi:PPOX class probable F420-dependent enzyme